MPKDPNIAFSCFACRDGLTPLYCLNCAAQLHEIQQLQNSISEWQQRTFPDETLEGKLAHLVDEAKELRADPKDDAEWADVLILLLGAAARNGKSVNDLVDAAKAKFAVARTRKWGPVNADGYRHHLPC